MAEVLPSEEIYTIRTLKHLVPGIVEVPVPVELGDENSIKIGMSKTEAMGLWQPLCVESTYSLGNESDRAIHAVSMYRPDFRPFFFDVVEPKHGIEKGMILARAVTRLSLESGDERQWRITKGAQVLSDRKQDFIGTMKLVALYADPLLRGVRTAET